MPQNRKVIIAGASGFIGSALVKEFQSKGYRVIALSRSSEPDKNADETLTWDGETVGDWKSALEGAEAVISVTGKPISVHWTPKVVEEIVHSRLKPTLALGLAMRECKNPPKVWVSASATGYYGHTFDSMVDERSKAGGDALAEVCVKWEKAAYDTVPEATRLILMRISIVLDHDGGVFPMLRKLVEMFIGGTAGDGKQYFPWIHRQDLARLYVWAVENEISGPLNATAPDLVTNEQFMQELRRLLGRPWAPPAPALALKLWGKIAGPPGFVLLHGQKARPRVAEKNGFEYEHPNLTATIKSICNIE